VKWFRRFLPHGVFWRQFLRWAVLNVPYWLEPFILGFWTALFMLWGSGRRAVMANLAAILPGSSRLANFFRVYRVFWNFAWVIDDNVRFKELRVVPDWEFVGREHFDRLRAESGGAIILTAHMGNYDLGAHLFAEMSKRPIVMVRAPETDPETRRFEEEAHDRTNVESLKIDFSTRASDLALDLLHAVQRGEIIAIQGDRVTPGISSLPATLFGKPTRVPAGPFALSMAARVPIYPLFITRLGRRRYKLIVCAPFEVKRTRDRSEAFDVAVAKWTHELELVAKGAWQQWFAFTKFEEDAVA
jgi:KDO2-lipid IV(A) lauroyltransferase